MKINANDFIRALQNETNQLFCCLEIDGHHALTRARRSVERMNKQCLRWKQVWCKPLKGPDVPVALADRIDLGYRGTLLPRILAMPEKQAISLDDAIQMTNSKLNEAFMAELFGDKPGQYGWYMNHFVDWISSLGYHIELTGDEFGAYIGTQFLS